MKVDTFPSKDFTGTPETATRRNIADWQARVVGARRTRRRAAFATPHRFKAGKAGKYLLLAAAAGDDTLQGLVDGKQVLEQTQAEGQVPESASLDLDAGQTVNVVADYLPALCRRPLRPRHCL